jgi:hypothetical protein
VEKDDPEEDLLRPVAATLQFSSENDAENDSLCDSSFFEEETNSNVL